jgi:hypothetical protein
MRSARSQVVISELGSGLAFKMMREKESGRERERERRQSTSIDW